jgi:hypothetical protein
LLCAPTLSQIEGSKTQSGYEWPKPRHISARARTHISVCTVLSLADPDAFATVRGHCRQLVFWEWRWEKNQETREGVLRKAQQQSWLTALALLEWLSVVPLSLEVCVPLMMSAPRVAKLQVMDEREVDEFPLLVGSVLPPLSDKARLWREFGCRRLLGWRGRGGGGVARSLCVPRVRSLSGRSRM